MLQNKKDSGKAADKAEKKKDRKSGNIQDKGDNKTPDMKKTKQETNANQVQNSTLQLLEQKR